MKKTNFSILVKRILIFCFLTVLTQIGGIIYIISHYLKNKFLGKKTPFALVFCIVYLMCTFFIIPKVAPIFGREPIKESSQLKAHHFFYKLTNRNYVHPRLNQTIKKVALQLNKTYPGIQLIYLDANFPFINKFPLLPHLSHNDGKKIDICLIYQDQSGKLTNKKKSRSGYGIFEEPKSKEIDQNKLCKKKGKWQYDFTKYLSFGKINKNIHFSNKANRTLLHLLIQEKSISKLFIEPHLQQRVQINNAKIRFHGCQAVRHDDHIHIQMN